MPKPSKSTAPWTPKQMAFREEFKIDRNATQAAIRAGYSERTARVEGPKLLRKPHIKAAIEEDQAALAEKSEITQEWVLDQLKSIVDRCIATGIDFNPMAANRSLELLGKHLGIFKSDGSGMPPININVIERRIVRPGNRDR